MNTLNVSYQFVNIAKYTVSHAILTPHYAPPFDLSIGGWCKVLKIVGF